MKNDKETIIKYFEHHNSTKNKEIYDVVNKVYVYEEFITEAGNINDEAGNIPINNKPDDVFIEENAITVLYNNLD